MRGKSNDTYFKGLIMLMFGGAGMAEYITAERGSFLISAIVFSIGFGMILWSYRK